MKPQEFKDLIEKTRTDLEEKVRTLTMVINSVDGDDHLLFHEQDVSAPIHRESSDENLTETISGIFIDKKTKKMSFTIDTFNEGYDADTEDISIENLLYMYDELYDIFTDNDR